MPRNGVMDRERCRAGRRRRKASRQSGDGMCVCEKGDRGSGGGWDETSWSARVEDVPAERSVEGETEGETEAGGTARRERLGRTRGGPGEP